MIKSEKEYTAIINRIEELLSVPENIENPEAKGYVELNQLSDLAADYEEEHHPSSHLLSPILSHKTPNE